MQIATKLPKVGTTIFTVMSQLAAEHGAVNLGQGFPDFAVPQRLVDELDRAMRAGHNPEGPAFANRLGDLDLGNLPTGGIVALEFHTPSWQEILPGQGQLLFVDFPKNVA